MSLLLEMITYPFIEMCIRDSYTNTICQYVYSRKTGKRLREIYQICLLYTSRCV